MAIYDNLDHALIRAFGQPRENYGKMLNFSGVISIGDRLSPMDQIAQDGITRHILETNLSGSKRMILYLVYDGSEDLHFVTLALDNYVKIFSEGRSDDHFVLESLARWSKRDLLNRKYPLKAWANRYNVTRNYMRDRRSHIYRSLNEMLSSAQGEATELLVSARLIN